MMNSIRNTLPWLGLLLLAGCGGGTQTDQIQPTNTIAVIMTTPASSVSAGATLQLSATVINSSNPNLLWYVDGLAAGNALVGTISPQGLYTAPSRPPAGGRVTITAAAQANPGASSTAVININFSNASLSGPYVFRMSGTESGKPWAAVGQFTAHGDGTLSGGLEDINGPAGISQSLSFTGSYLLDSDGQGSGTLVSSQGSLNFQLAMTISGSAQLMRADAGGVATGTLIPQIAATVTTTSLNAPYVFSFTGTDGGGKLMTLAGLFVTNGSTSFSSGETDVNDNGSITSDTPLSGSYTLAGNGRGTATFSDATGTRHYTFYLVSPGQLEFLGTDSSVQLSGEALQQTNISIASALPGSYSYYVSGSNAGNAYSVAGAFLTNNAGSFQSNGAQDINANGATTQAIATSGGYSIDSTGRGLLTISGSTGSNNYVFYQISPNQSWLVAADSGIVASGKLVIQNSSAFSASTYSLLLASPLAASTPSAMVGVITANGVGTYGGNADSNLNGVLSGDLALALTYGISSGRVTGTFTSNGVNTDYVFYPGLNNGLIFMSLNAAPQVGTLVPPF